MKFSNPVNLKKVDQSCLLLIKFQLICSDTKLPKCYTMKQGGMSLITNAHSSALNVSHGALHKKPPQTSPLRSTNIPASADSLECMKMRWFWNGAWKYSGLGDYCWSQRGANQFAKWIMRRAKEPTLSLPLSALPIILQRAEKLPGANTHRLRLCVVGSGSRWAPRVHQIIGRAPPCEATCQGKRHVEEKHTTSADGLSDE